MWPHVPMPVLRPRLYYGHKWPVPRVAVIEAFYCISIFSTDNMILLTYNYIALLTNNVTLLTYKIVHR